MIKKRVFETVIFLVIVSLIGLVLLAKDGVYEKVPFEETRVLMDTFVTIKIFGQDKEGIEKAAEVAFGEIERLDTLMNFYSDKSELSAINRAAGTGFVEISKDTFNLLSISQKIAGETGGAFDPSVGSIEHLWDFVNKKAASPDDLVSAVALVGYEKIELNEKTRSVRLAESGMKIDLGGVVKGYALDRATDILKTRGIKSALLTMGSTTKVVGKKPGGQPWKIGIQNPRPEGDDYLLGTILLSELTLSTSGDYQRYFEDNGVRFHHILNPKTGMPSLDLMSVSIVGDISAAEADGLSTAVFVMGLKEGLAFVERDPRLEGVFVSKDGIVISTSGLENKLEGLKENVRS